MQRNENADRCENRMIWEGSFVSLREGRMLKAWETGSLGCTSETEFLWWSRWSHWMVCTADHNGLTIPLRSWWATRGSLEQFYLLFQHLRGHLSKIGQLDSLRTDRTPGFWARIKKKSVSSEQIQSFNVLLFQRNYKTKWENNFVNSVPL